MPTWIVLSFVDLLDSEVGGDVVSEGGVDGARGMRVASAASIVRVGEAFRSGNDEVDDSYDGRDGASISRIVISPLDRLDPNEVVDVSVS